ncbi:hypothetical protein MTO96_006373 [Rhipicephalus appendiculatus]
MSWRPPTPPISKVRRPPHQRASRYPPLSPSGNVHRPTLETMQWRAPTPPIRKVRSSGGARSREQIMMHVFRRDITLWLGFIFLVCVITQVPTCVLAGLRPTKSRYPQLKIPTEIHGHQGYEGRPPAPPPGPPTEYVSVTWTQVELLRPRTLIP